MNANQQKRMPSEGPRTKTSFSGFTFKHIVDKKYSKKMDQVFRIKYGKIKDDIDDSAELSLVSPDGKKIIPVMFNRRNFIKIIRDHGYFNTADIVVTANEYEEGIFIKGTGGKPDKINLIKNTDKGCFILAANRFNGYGVVTFFEQYDQDQKQQYLASVHKRGISFRTWRAAGPHPSISRSTTDARDRVPASLSGVRADKA